MMKSKTLVDSLYPPKSSTFFQTMIKIYFSKFLNIFRFLFYNIINVLILIKLQKKNAKTLLIIRLDAIGDYILVRNFLHSLKQSNKYKDYKITLCGNIVWKDLAETFDNNSIDEFIWINRKCFNNNIFYKYKTLNQIYQRGFEVVIDTTFSREILFGDSIVNTSKAKVRIGSTGSIDAYVKWKRNLLADKFYTRLIPQSSENIFEFYRNRDFFAKVLNESINFRKPDMTINGIDIEIPTKNDFLLIFPGAQEEKRRWSVEKYVIVIQDLLTKLNVDVIIAGSKSEINITKKIIYNLSTHRAFDMTGKTTLPQLAKIISLAKVLISNETSAIHFAAAVGTPFVCISNGQRLGRFMPYPVEMNIKGKYIYPFQIENQIDNFKMLSKKYQFDSDLDINSITAESVIKAVSEIM